MRWSYLTHSFNSDWFLFFYLSGSLRVLWVEGKQVPTTYMYQQSEKCAITYPLAIIEGEQEQEQAWY